MTSGSGNGSLSAEINQPFEKPRGTPQLRAAFLGSKAPISIYETGKVIRVASDSPEVPQDEAKKQEATLEFD